MLSPARAPDDTARVQMSQDACPLTVPQALALLYRALSTWDPGRILALAQAARDIAAGAPANDVRREGER